MPRYVWENGGFHDRRTGERMPVPERDGLCMPRLTPDIEDYLSPVTGERVSSRSGQREDLKRHDCVLAPPRERPRGYRNARFAKKYGLPLKED